jgi:amidase
MSSSILEMSASELAKAIRDKKLRSVEVVTAYLEQIKKHNPKINAIVTLCEESALLRAHQADDELSRGNSWGPLHGVPFTVKDSWQTKNVKTTCK